MVDTADILVEIGTEELPPKALYRLAQAFHHLLADELLPEAGLGAAASRWYCSPRRLAMFIEQAPLKQGDREEERLGPKVEAAFDCHGQPTKAAAGFARSCNVEVEALERRETPRGERLAYRRSIAGRSTREILPELVTAALKRLPIPRQMRWNASEMQFVRPVHWVVLLLGEAVVEADILGVQTGRMTRGHRFHHPEPLEIVMPSAYAAVLREQGQVFVERGETRPLMAEIERGVSLTAAEAGGEAELDRALLEEVSALVEWPVALAGHFEPRFLELPDEVLVATLAGQQRYFPIRDPEGRLLPAFIVVSNIESRSPDTVRRGNERVIAPRLADAMFFWNTDRKTPLAVRRSELDRVIFQEDLGSLGDKTRRVAALAAAVAPPIGVERDSAHRAAELAKCDLVTLMVGEFPELQGAMGAYYARHDGEPAEVATAIREHYLPRFAGDRRRASAGDRRSARYAHGLVRHRRAADRRQGPVRAQTRRARPVAHHHRRRTGTRSGRLYSFRRRRIQNGGRRSREPGRGRVSLSHGAPARLLSGAGYPR
jgi:glycyl-tRNA synthetase beta chain